MTDEGIHRIEFQQPVQGPVIGNNTTIIQTFGAVPVATPERIWNVPFSTQSYFYRA